MPSSATPKPTPRKKTPKESKAGSPSQVPDAGTMTEERTAEVDTTAADLGKAALDADKTLPDAEKMTPQSDADKTTADSDTTTAAGNTTADITSENGIPQPKEENVTTPQHKLTPDEIRAEEKQSALLRMRNIVPLLVGFITKKADVPLDEAGRWHGYGVVQFERGHRYEGEMVHGMLEGEGTITWPDGTHYTGQFQRSVMSGEGTFTWSSRSEYKGSVCCGRRHGWGVFLHPNGYSYAGNWQHGAKHGEGCMFFGSEADSTYDGDWIENQRQGNGHRIYPSGNDYLGEWKAGKQDGAGKMNWYRLCFFKETYEGEWKDGLQHGEGYHCWRTHQLDPVQHPRYNSYHGQFRKGERHGEGVFQYASDSSFVGTWRHNFKSGTGEFTDIVQNVTRQDFIDDKVMYVCQPSESANTMMCVYSDMKDFEHLLKPTYHLDMEPLLQGLPEEQQALVREQVWTVLRRHITELRLNYSYYAGLGTEGLAEPEYLAMTQLQWWQMMRDCDVHLSGVPAQVLMGIPWLACGTGHPLSVVHFHEYLLMFLLLADVLYTSEEDWQLAERVGMFIEQVMLVQDARAVTGLTLTLPLNQRPLRDQLELLYNEFQRETPCTVRTAVRALGNGRVPGFEAVRPRLALRAARQVVPRVVVEDTLDMELELTFIDFCELLLVTRKLVSEHHSVPQRQQPNPMTPRMLYERRVPTYALLQYKFRLANAVRELAAGPKKGAGKTPGKSNKKAQDKSTKSTTTSSQINRELRAERTNARISRKHLSTTRT